MNSALLDRAAALARSFAATCLLLAPGLALSYCLFPRRTLDLLERAYLGALSSLALLTLFGVALLERKGDLDPWLLARCALACTAGCLVWAVLSRASGRRQRKGRAKPSGVGRRTSIWVHGTRSYIPAPFVTRVYPVPVRRNRRGKSKTRPAPSGEHALRTCETPSNLSSIARRALGPASLLAIAALTLLAYRVLAVRPLPGGPVVAFSVPGDRIVDTQAALRQGGHVAVPFRIENLSPHDATYRVEAWAVSAPAATLESVKVAAGETYCGALQVDLLLEGDGVPVDLYLFPGEAAVPLAHVRLWPAE